MYWSGQTVTDHWRRILCIRRGQLICSRSRLLLRLRHSAFVKTSASADQKESQRGIGTIQDSNVHRFLSLPVLSGAVLTVLASISANQKRVLSISKTLITRANSNADPATSLPMARCRLEKSEVILIDGGVFCIANSQLRHTKTWYLKRGCSYHC